MAVQRHRSRGFQKSARLTTWIGPADQGFVNVAAGANAIISSVSFEDPLTVMRVRGMVSVIPQVFNADLTIVGAYGLAVVSTEAFVAGAASIPGPWDDPDWGGWFVWRSFGFRLEFGTAVSLNFIPWQFEIDSKAMRKISPNETMVTMAEGQSGAFALFSGVRKLVKLP